MDVVRLEANCSRKLVESTRDMRSREPTRGPRAGWRYWWRDGRHPMAAVLLEWGRRPFGPMHSKQGPAKTK